MDHDTMSIGGVSAVRLAKKFGTPLYVYDGGMIRAKCRELKKYLPGMELYFACKANTNPEIVKLIFKEGFGMETVSPGEIRAARNAGVPASKITFTCSSIDEDEIVRVVTQGVRIHLDSLAQVEMFGRHFPGRNISVRLNQGIGAGHHSHVITGGVDSKFGIDVSQIGQLENLAAQYGLRITGLHQHIGSNILEVPVFLKAMKALCATALRFPHLSRLDFGGGFGVPYRPEDGRLDMRVLGKKVRLEALAFAKRYGRRVNPVREPTRGINFRARTGGTHLATSYGIFSNGVKMSFEPGRYPVAEAGYLLVRVNDVKRNPTKTFVGVNSGFNHLIRPAMYGSYHEIANVSASGGEMERVTVAGNICESGDVFAKDRMLRNPRIGDILAIKNAGAYGYVMSSDYNLRPRPREVVVIKGKCIP